jgi:PKD-like domain
MRNLLKITLLLLSPAVVFSQIEVQKVTPASIGSFLPIPYPINFSSPTITFQFTAPPIVPFGLPDSLNVDSNYDNLDDTTYEYYPKLQYGVPLKARLSISNGVWQTVGSMNVWSLKVVILDALNTSATFSNFILSPTAKLYIINGENTILKGPFLKETFGGITQFGTFPMDGNAFTIVLYEPNNTNLIQNNLSITQVVAGYQSVSGNEPLIIDTTLYKKDPLRCINSIRCYSSWMTLARSVARWANGEGSACTGTLLNNEAGNGIPFFYSACHCLPNNRATLRNASFQFNFWQTGCNTETAPRGIEFFGATLLHEESQSNGDQAFMRLNTGPGIGDAPTYAGWNRSNTNPSAINAGIIHHAESRDMRFTRPNNIRNFLWDNDFWKINYNDGVVKPGSSGCGIFNAEEQVIGTLSKGLSKCGWKQYILGDRYGKFSTSWNGTRTFLSPLQNIQNVSSLKLNQLHIIGQQVLGCITTSEAYSVPNLTGCSYTWTTSSNLQITSGAGTNRIIVLYNFNGTTPISAWINVVINDSKGTFPSGRRAETRLNLTTNQLIGTTDAAYHYDYILSPQTVSLWGTNNASVTYNITDPTITPIGWTILTPNTSDAGAYIQGNMVTMSFNGQAGGYVACDFTYSGPCGIMTKRLEAHCLQGQSKNSLRIKANLNPVKDNVFITVESDIKEIAKLNQSIHFDLIDINTKTVLKKWDMKNIQSQYNLNIAEFKSGVYLLQVILGEKTENIKIMKL